MRAKKRYNRMERTSSISPEVENVFTLVSQEKIEELTEYILNEQNQIWNLKRGEDLTILHNACAIDKTNVIETIVEQTKKRLKLTPEFSLSEEEKSQNLEIFKNFINAKTQIDNQTALHYASFRGNIKIIKLLLENYAEINALSANGYNMIHKAAQGNKPSAIIFFNKKYNMSLDATDENLMNALHLASANGMDNSVIFLLSLGLDPNIKDKYGYTALHYAVKKNHVRIIKKLLQRGADRNIEEYKTKKTPVMLAKNKPEILEIFRKKGVCEKLFFKPDISQKTLCSNKNMIFFISLHLIIFSLVFFIIVPDFNNTIFSIIYLSVSCIVFVLYFHLSFSNPGKMTSPYKDLLSIVEKGEEAENYCPYCLVKKTYRSLHCLICQICVDEFDHHCFWVGNCIGKKNYTLFFIFLVYILLNTLFNVITNIYFLVKEIKEEKDEDTAFPYYLDEDAFIYKLPTRIVVSICCFIICICFFIPLFSLFRMQLNTAIEKRQLKRDEEEYERNQLREKLDEEVWEDLVYDENDNEVVEMDVKEKDENDNGNTEPLIGK
jgi:palmitoyltransferase